MFSKCGIADSLSPEPTVYREFKKVIILCISTICMLYQWICNIL